MAHLVAAPDKFRGTASAAEVAHAIARAAAQWLVGRRGPHVRRWRGPLGGGRGTPQYAVGARTTRPAHPGRAGASLTASGVTPTASAVAPTAPGVAPTAIIEMSRVAGRALLPQPGGDDPVAADTAGVGHLLLAVRAAGASRIVIGCGGSATTDGGWGAVEVIGSPQALAGLDVVVACDVTTPFLAAAAVFGAKRAPPRRRSPF